jgi:signal peptide peptidase SppA
MGKQYSRITRAITGQPWFILPEKLEAICEFIEAKSRGVEFNEREIASRVAAATPGQRQSGAVAVLPLFGVISQRVNLMSDISGGTSIERFTAAFRQLVSDSSVKAIVLDVDSPGGAVYGVDELSQEIFKARGTKPIVAVANSFAASAAYYIASAADEVVITPSGEVGSIGTVMVHIEESKWLEKEGFGVRMLYAGKYKTEGNPYEPMTDEAAAAFQGRIDEYYDAFVKAVARNRGTAVATVKSDYGQGRVLGAKAALAAGMVDRIATLDQTIKRLGGAGESRGMALETEQSVVAAVEQAPEPHTDEPTPDPVSETVYGPEDGLPTDTVPAAAIDWQRVNARLRLEHS